MFSFFYKTIYLNEEVKSSEPSPSVRVPWADRVADLAATSVTKKRRLVDLPTVPAGGLKISMKDLQSVHLRKTEVAPQSKYKRQTSAPGPQKKGIFVHFLKD